MRIVAFSDFAPPERGGGVENALGEIYERLAARYGATIHLVALGSPASPTTETLRGMTIHRAARIDFDRRVGAQVAVSPKVWPLGFATVRDVRPDLVHAHTLFFHSSLVAAAAARRYGVPLLLTAHVGSLSALPQPQRAAALLYERFVGKRLLAIARRVIAVSDDVRTHLERLGVASERITVIPNGVDVERFQPAVDRSSSRVVVVSVGRLIANKGQHLLLDAMAELRAEGLDFELRLVGDGPLRRDLETQVGRLGLSDSVRFLGEQSRVEDTLRDADIFVRPSFTEGMSLAVLEAMATGLACVVTDVSGSRQLICDGRDGVIVPPRDTAALASAMRGLLLDRERRQRLGGAARSRARAFSWDGVADATFAEFARVIG